MAPFLFTPLYRLYRSGIIYLNEDLCIKNVDESVWNYTIGGYQVIDKWLKYRVGYECSRDDLEHLVNICKIIERTIDIQKELDDLYDI